MICLRDFTEMCEAGNCTDVVLMSVMQLAWCYSSHFLLCAIFHSALSKHSAPPFGCLSVANICVFFLVCLPLSPTHHITCNSPSPFQGLCSVSLLSHKTPLHPLFCLVKPRCDQLIRSTSTVPTFHCHCSTPTPFWHPSCCLYCYCYVSVLPWVCLHCLFFMDRSSLKT